MFYYYCAAAYLYFLCEWLKATGWLAPLQNDSHYHTCVSFFEHELTDDVTRSVCDMLNREENFTKFVNNGLYLFLTLHALTHHLNFSHFDPWYWVVAWVTAFVYSFLNNISYFQFSIDSHTGFQPSELVVCAAVALVCSGLLLRQCWTRRIRWQTLGYPCLLYLVMFGLFFSVDTGMSWHLHHAILSGFLSLCFTEFEVQTNRILHAGCIGLIVQGFNFYTVEEILLFRIHYHPPPTLLYMSLLLVALGGCCVGYAGYRWFTRQEKKEDDSLRIQLIPKINQ